MAFIWPTRVAAGPSAANSALYMLVVFVAVLSSLWSAATSWPLASAWVAPEVESVATTRNALTRDVWEFLKLI